MEQSFLKNGLLVMTVVDLVASLENSVQEYVGYFLRKK